MRTAAALAVAQPGPSRSAARAFSSARQKRASCEVASDPAGGFRIRKASLRVRVPATLLASQRAQVEKTVGLAEKYCIVSKVVRAAVPLDVAIEEV